MSQALTPRAHDPMTWPGRVYLGFVIAFGASVIAHSLYVVHFEPLGYQWYILAALALLSGSATVQLPSVPASISVSETFVFAAVLLFGTAAGTVTVALEGLVISFWMAKRRPEWYRALFNTSAPAVSCWCAAQVFPILGIEPLIHGTPATLNTLLGPVAVFAVFYFGLNSWLIAAAVSFETRHSAFPIWRKNLLWLSLNYFSAASVALLLVVYTRDLDFRFIAATVPLILGFYFIYKISLERVEDANQHLQQLNRLYLSTIETLAMAIDAKDQITHGHIRRVQALAVGLAKEVGIKEESSLRAIEAAALLHDMGKLAVPEYILNKPGKLSAAEFEKMKLHASVGADILSAIDFPYPVVPIVRHHHENWDGTGYPTGLRGTEIPIGARVLSVVDCFDALTSDRPYRPRLPNEEAIKILQQRRATMYDPLVVDAFIRIHHRIAPEPVNAGPTRQALDEITSSTQLPTFGAGATRLDEIAASADEMLTLYELSRALAGQASTSDTGDIIAKHIRRLVPFSLCVFYIFDAATDELEAKHAMGDAASNVRGLRIQVGQRLSGWVAANRQSIVNSDPTLDLGEVARCVTPRLRNCLSTPLQSDDGLVGVLTLYSSTSDGFTEDHRRIVEAVAGQIAHTFKSAGEFDRATRRDPLTGLPDLHQLEHVIEAIARGGVMRASLAFINIVDLKEINIVHGRATGDDVIRHVVQQTRAELRLADILFRFGSHEFVALLNDSDRNVARAVASRIDDAIRRKPVLNPTGRPITVNARVTWVCSPDDGESMRELVTAARLRVIGSSDRDSPSVH
jgi:diguanylate cyclase (GGDEF)-like protein/putative nucleotidyltransferase with HDIG domain